MGVIDYLTGAIAKSRADTTDTYRKRIDAVVEPPQPPASSPAPSGPYSQSDFNRPDPNRAAIRKAGPPLNPDGSLQRKGTRDNKQTSEWSE